MNFKEIILYSFSIAFWGLFIYGPVLLLLDLFLSTSVAVTFVFTFLISFATMYIVREIKKLNK